MKRKEAPSPEKNPLQNNSNPEKMSKIENKTNEDVTTNKEEKYDRQLRLWGHNGQRDLEHAHVCLLNVTAAGTEALKCLVLPGVGKFSIVDNTKITDVDLGNNFFLDSSNVGQSKAKIACELLQELNPDTHGAYFDENPMVLLDNDPEFFKSISVVICSRLSEHDLFKLGNYLWLHNIPLIVCDNFGFLGILRLIVKEHVIIEAHPDNTLEDLRLDQPFVELSQYMDAIDLDKLDRLEHSHTPYLVILYKYLQEWSKQNGKAFPSNYKEKRQIKDLIRTGILKNEHGVEIDEENFEEAIQNVNNALVETKIPSNVQSLLDDDMANHPLKSETNSIFWILVRALKEFVSQNNTLPLRGTLPDMFADSKRYIELQNIFKSKAMFDCDVVIEFVREALDDLQLPASYISNDLIKVFCKNSAFLQLLRGFSLHDEFRQEHSSKKIKDSLSSTTEKSSDIYLIYRALLQFADREGTFPQSSEEHLNKMKTILSELITTLSLERKIPDEYLVELFRCNIEEIHSTAAIMGGLCSQEVIKIITKQFVPVDNMFLYDGISHESTAIKL